MAELKVNALNQLKLFKQSTFKDPLCFLDEDIQNAQRAGAKNIKIEFNYDDTLTIFNDGEVLDDPQNLFSIAESGWDDEVQESENPFGIGFFSNIVASDLILVATGDKQIVFDVNHILETGDTTINIGEGEEYCDGFKITLFPKDLSYYAVKVRVQELARYITDIDIYFNDELMHKAASLTEFDDPDLPGTVIESSDIGTGFLCLEKYSWNSKVEIYNHGRFVCDLEGFPYISGRIHLPEDHIVLTLRSPDRKDIIIDDKYYEFKSNVSECIKTLCTDIAIREDDPDTAKTYGDAVSHYADLQVVHDQKSFRVYKTKNSDDMEFLDGIASARSDNSNISTIAEYREALKNKKLDKNVDNTAEEEINIDIVPTYNPDNDLPDEPNDDDNNRYYTQTGIDNMELENQLKTVNASTSIVEEDNMESLINSDEPIFYLKISEIEKYREEFVTARHYNLRLILCDTNMDFNFLSKMESHDETGTIKHISQLEYDVTINAKVTRKKVTLSDKEHRAMMLLDYISKALGYDHNLFAVGELSVTKTITIKGTDLVATADCHDIGFVYDHERNKIYMDSRMLKAYRLGRSAYSTLTVKDMQFLLANRVAIGTALYEYSDRKYDMTTFLNILCAYDSSSRIDKFFGVDESENAAYAFAELD